MDPLTLALAVRHDERADTLEVTCTRLAAVAHDLDRALDVSRAAFGEQVWAGRTANTTRDVLADSRAELRSATDALHRHIADGRARARALRAEAAELRARASMLP